MFPVTPYGKSKVDAERELHCSPTTTSAPPTCATRPPTARRPGSALTSWSTTSPPSRSPPARCTCKATAPRGGRWCTSRTSAARSSRCLRHRARSSTTRRSTSGAPRTTCRSATWPRWSARRYPARAHVRRGRGPGPAQLPGRLQQAERHVPRPADEVERPRRDHRAARGVHQVRPDLRRLHVAALRPAPPRFASCSTRVSWTTCSGGRASCGPCRRVPDVAEAEHTVPARTVHASSATVAAGPQATTGSRSVLPGGLRLARVVAHRFSWGLADQAMSSLSNAAVSLYIARQLGATAVRRVQRGLRDLLVRAERVTRPGHRPAARQVQPRRAPGLEARRAVLHRRRRRSSAWSWGSSAWSSADSAPGRRACRSSRSASRCPG